jgi:HEAT repeat protein
MRKVAHWIVAFSLIACNTDPSKPGYWVSRLSSRKVQDRIEACHHLRRMKDTDAVPKIALALKDEDPRVRTAAADALGDLGDRSVVPALAEAIDFSVAGGSDRETRAVNEANQQIATALGLLGDKAAVPPLLKLLRSRDRFVKLSAVEALGKLRDPAAVEPLLTIASDDNEEPFIVKKAIMALGDIGDPRAVPVVIRMLFRERQGVSFYAESSYALFEIGEPAATPLIRLLEGQDKEMEKWASENNVVPEALYAKTAQVLGDLGDPRAGKALIGRLHYESATPLKLLVRSSAAESLGRLRDKDAAKPIGGLLGEDEANIRESYGRALVLIGVRDVLPQLLKASQTGSYDAREGSIHALSNLGTGKELPEVEKLVAAEPARWAKECKDDGYEEAACKESLTKHLAILASHISRLKTAKECGEDAACWTAKLKDPSGPIRERAAYELGRLGDPKALTPLLDAVQDDDLNARFAMLSAISWLVLSPAGSSQAKAAYDRLTGILVAEEGKVYYIKIDEDVKRLALRLHQRVQAARG